MSRVCRSLLVRFACALALALLGGASPAQPLDVVEAVATENRALAQQIDAVAAALGAASGELAALEKARGDLHERVERIERRTEVHAIGHELARTLVLQLRQLPRPGHFDDTRRERSDLLAATSDENLRAEDELRDLSDLDAALERRLATMQPPPAPAERQRLEIDLRAGLVEQRGLLERLIARQRELFGTLHAVAVAERELEQQYRSAHVKLTEILYWVPAPPGLQTVNEIPAALAWTVSPANWRSAAETLATEFALRPFWPALAVLLAVLLLVARRRLQRALVELAPAAVTLHGYSFGHALTAVACTAALAAPVPLMLAAAESLLGSAAADTPLFPFALGDALGVTWRLLFALSAFAWLLDRRGIAVNHFGRDAASLDFAARAVRRFRDLFVPLIFVTALNGLNNVPWAHRESLGRLSFILAMLASAAFLAHLLRRGSPLVQQLFDRAPRGMLAGMHGFWLTALVALPLAMAVLATTGYFVVAGYFFGRVVMSLFWVLGALTLYGLLALWAQVRRFHLARRQRAAAPRLAAAEIGAEVADVPTPRVDLASLDEQMRALFDLLVVLVLLVGLYWVWKDALQNLAFVGEHPLWTVTDTVDGKAVVRHLTLNRMLLAILAIAVTAIVVRNIGALLDIALLQRFDMRPDATYAVKVIARYAFAAIGVVLASRILSIDWSDAQWLVAALGVGLGFGLQEIVANFVSGLIVLAERPVRIGDTITVGNITGKVLGIKARATVVVDSESREVIIPNKALITERVTNWTLTDQTTRLLLKIRVADGTDIGTVQQLLLGTIAANPEVLATPPASVFLVGFGDSALEFEVRACVSSLDKRLRVQHELYAAIDRTLRTHGVAVPFPQRDPRVAVAPPRA